MPPTEKDVYIKRVLKLRKGTPLYQPCAVQVGDVGFIDPLDGSFQALYNIAHPPTSDEPGCPRPIKLEFIRHPEQLDAFHVSYLSCFILRTSSDFVIVSAEEIKEVRSLIESSHVGWLVAVPPRITETRSSAPKVKRKSYSQK